MLHNFSKNMQHTNTHIQIGVYKQKQIPIYKSVACKQTNKFTKINKHFHAIGTVYVCTVGKEHTHFYTPCNEVGVSAGSFHVPMCFHVPVCCGWFSTPPPAHTLSIAFRHLPPNSARFSYATEGTLFISVQLSSDTVSALRKARVLIWLWKQPSAKART